MYYHGVINGLVNKKVLDILEKGEISSAARLGLTNRIGFNEDDYVSICVNLGKDEYDKYKNNAFEKYIVNHFCFIINDSIEVEKPVFLENASDMNRGELVRLKLDNPDKRYSDLIDERQVKSFISLENVVAIGIPYNLQVVDGYVKLSNFCFLTVDEFLSLVSKVEGYAERQGIKIVDSTSPDFNLMFEDRKFQK